jgi:hypothetical protein
MFSIAFGAEQATIMVWQMNGDGTLLSFYLLLVLFFLCSSIYFAALQCKRCETAC